MPEGVKFVLGVAAGKGGVGKSTLTAHLAMAFQEMGWKVGVLDADLYGPSLPKMLPPEQIVEQSRIDPTRIVPAQALGIKLVSFSFFSEEGSAAIVRAPIANRVIKQFLHQVDWGPLDCLLIDFPPGTGDIQLTLMQEGGISAGILVTTPQEVALLDVSKAIEMFDLLHIPIVGVVENMSYFQEEANGAIYRPFGQGGAERLSRERGIPYLGEIPIDSTLCRACDRGLSLFHTQPDSLICSILRGLARQVKEQLEAFEYLEGEYLKNFELVWS